MYLCCKDHNHLRWHTKSLAWSPKYGYTGSRGLFYFGAYDRHEAGATDVWECECPAASLRWVPPVRNGVAIYTRAQMRIAWDLFAACYEKWETTRDSAYWLVAQKLLARYDRMVAQLESLGAAKEGVYNE
jgi:hypothetical protein